MSSLKILALEMLMRLSLSAHVETVSVDNGRRFISRLKDCTGWRVYESPFCSSRQEARQRAREYRDFLVLRRRRDLEWAWR